MVRTADSLLPQIAADFGVTVGVASIVVTAYALTHGSMQLVIGPIGDRFGKYRTVAIACALSRRDGALCGLAWSLDSADAGALRRGATAGWIMPIGLAYIGDVVPYEQRQQVLGRYLAGQMLGQLFGQAAGGMLGDLLRLARVFFVLAAMFAVAAVALELRARHQSADPRRRTRRRDSRGFDRRLHRPCCRNPWARVMLCRGVP